MKLINNLKNNLFFFKLSKKHSWVVILILFLSISCSEKPDKIKILVIGDVQLKSDLESYTKDAWLKQSMDTLAFRKQFKYVIEKEQPDYIFQTGDWVNYNDQFSLQILDTLGTEIEQLQLPYSEWEFMNQHLKRPLKDNFFMAMGNHESYKSVILEGVSHPDHDILGNVNSNIELFKSKTGKAALVKQFPHLRKAEFNNTTATYFIDNKHFTLLSIDGLDKDRKALLAFVESKLKYHNNKTSKKPLFVISHYPIFTGLDKENDSKLIYADIRSDLINLFDQYKVDYYLNGHEHFYLRYSENEQKNLFPEPYPKHTEYITVSDFANPYSRKIKRRDSSGIIKPKKYFQGSHYLLIEIEGNQIRGKTYGYNNDKDTWELIDTFSSKKQ